MTSPLSVELSIPVFPLTSPVREAAKRWAITKFRVEAWMVNVWVHLGLVSAGFVGLFVLMVWDDRRDRG